MPRMNKNDERIYWIWLSDACGAGSKCAVSLVRALGSAREVFLADEDDLEKCGVRIEKSVFSRLLNKNTDGEEDILRWCGETGVSVTYPGDEKYPPGLLSLRDAPMALYYVGVIPDFTEIFSCAVVGTRTMTDYGRKTAYDIGCGLAHGGACLVSGLALGIDGMAMSGAIDAGGCTIAVLGCGIDVVYPREHEMLLRKVLERGAVMTEYAPGSSPLGAHFPVRNRIISGIAQAVCVVEGSMRSGSLITARHAIFQGRDLYAVPGRVGDSGAAGTNHLIKEGAQAVTEAEDILSVYEFIYPHSIHISSEKHEPGDAEEAQERLGVSRRGGVKRQEKKEKEKKKEIFPPEEKASVPAKHIDYDMLGEIEMNVYRAMKPDIPMLAEEICRTGIPISQVMSSLTMLEIAGAVEAGAGGYFLRHSDDDEVGEPAISELDEGL